ncbi:MAG: PD40 domain-containing protein [Phycisphaerae bacterium]|nr:PD40 domain-containing protein [Phycisphaerae bacterium]
MKYLSLLCGILFFLLVPSTITRAEQMQAPDARMLRFPDVSAERIVFVYAGDLWTVAKQGGLARKLSSPKGREQFPKFSPDGRTIAFSGNYDGNTDVYTIPTDGGTPYRLTHHSSSDLVVEWYPGGKNILYRSRMFSPSTRFNRFFKQPVEGGMPETLPLPYGELATFSADGNRMAFQFISREFRTWKRYRGGMASDIWLYDFTENTSEKLTDFSGTDAVPMWHEDTIYFLSDRDEHKKLNIWAFDLGTKKPRQVTKFIEYDVKWPSIGPDAIIFENAGRLHLLDLAEETSKPVLIQVPADLPRARTTLKSVSGNIRTYSLSPSGRRALFEARGEIFTVPQEHGSIRNLTNTPGVAERYPAWSPDGKLVAYFSDKTGEYELYTRSGDGKGEEKQITEGGSAFRYYPLWSPDSNNIAFTDKTGSLFILDIEKGRPKFIDKDEWSRLSSYSWSADSRWLAYAKTMPNRNRAIMIYDTDEQKTHQVTGDYYDDDDPVFDPEGDYLFFRSDRAFAPVYGDMDYTWIYPNSTEIYAATLRKDVGSPIAPRSDEEYTEEKDKDEEENDKDKDQGDTEQGKEEESDKAKRQKTEDREQKSRERKRPGETEDDKDEEPAEDAKKNDKNGKKQNDKDDKDKDKPVEIDFDGFQGRIVKMPIDAGNIGSLDCVKGKLTFSRYAAAGSPRSDDPSGKLLYYDLKEREEKTVISGISSYRLSGDGKKVIYRSKSTYGIIDLAAGKKVGDGKISTSKLKAWIDPHEEWRQIFTEAWRVQRDFFYDPNMHGLDWSAIKKRYEALLDYVVDREDLNYVIGEMIAELNASHTYVRGGDIEYADRISVGLLGCDFELDAETDAYRISKIYEGAVWDAEVRSPLRTPGIEVNEGDYLLAVNGKELDTSKDPWAAFQGLAGEVVELTINDEPDTNDAREITVKPASSEFRLRNLAWIEANRRKVQEATNNRVGYIYVPNTSISGQNELVRQFTPQWTKEALIIDERFNSGGQIPDRFIELLDRPLYNYWARRDHRDWRSPFVAHAGPKVMLINGWSGSGGDAFPYYFRKAGLGPLIGTRTWGGLIGISGNPQPIDGGSVSVPTFGFWNTEGEWAVEGYGVDPDYPLENEPHKMAAGQDPQLEKAIEVILELLEKQPPPKLQKPIYPDRSDKVE